MIEYSIDDWKSLCESNEVFDKADTDPSDWNQFINGEDLKIWYRKPSDPGVYHFYFDKYINAPVENTLVIMGELQKFKEWVPMVYDTEFTYKMSAC